ncbi:hypothetical protein D3C71_2168290 [compost metagenome]
MVANTGRDSGNTIRKNVRSSPAPSIVEASISAGGTLIWKYVFIISTLNGDSSIGTTSAQMEFLRSSTWV